MATFDEAQVTSLAEMFETTSDYMAQFLSIRAGVITAADKTSILLRVTAFQAIETDNVEIEARERNFGANVSAAKKRNLIKSKIAGLIGWESVTTGSRLVRS